MAEVTHLQDYHRQINDDIKKYVQYLRESSQKEFGDSSTEVVGVFCDALTASSKHIRGMFTTVAYQMCGGTNTAMINQAARAMEMLHTALLIIDDIQDRSPMRRGQPAAHVRLAKTYGDKHLGESLAINAALLGNYAAEMILANLDVEPELRANVLSITNRTLLTTIHGQNADQLSGPGSTVPASKITLWKTAQYSVLNPLHVGMVLAGAGCEDTDAITPYALEFGQAFQIINDIGGVFGEADKTGKDPLDDIKEGKRTIITEFAFEHASPADQKILKACLGNADLTGSDFRRCQGILKRCGALQNAQQQANMHIQQALDSLEDIDRVWNKDDRRFLHELTENLLVA